MPLDRQKMEMLRLSRYFIDVGLATSKSGASCERSGSMAKKEHLFVAHVRGSDKKFSPEELMARWVLYKAQCDGRTKLTTISETVVGEDGEERTETVRREVSAPCTYTIDGFCLFLPLSRRLWYGYKDDEDYADVCEAIEDECKQRARELFEDGTLNSRLAGIWMGRYPEYSTRQETTVNGSLPVVISGEGDLSD